MRDAAVRGGPGGKGRCCHLPHGRGGRGVGKGRLRGKRPRAHLSAPRRQRLGRKPGAGRTGDGSAARRGRKAFGRLKHHHRRDYHLSALSSSVFPGAFAGCNNAAFQRYRGRSWPGGRAGARSGSSPKHATHGRSVPPPLLPLRYRSPSLGANTGHRPAAGSRGGRGRLTASVPLAFLRSPDHLPQCGSQPGAWLWPQLASQPHSAPRSPPSRQHRCLQPPHGPGRFDRPRVLPPGCYRSFAEHRLSNACGSGPFEN